MTKKSTGKRKSAPRKPKQRAIATVADRELASQALVQKVGEAEIVATNLEMVAERYKRLSTRKDHVGEHARTSLPDASAQAAQARRIANALRLTAQTPLSVLRKARRAFLEARKAGAAEQYAKVQAEFENLRESLAKRRLSEADRAVLQEPLEKVERIAAWSEEDFDICEDWLA